MKSSILEKIQNLLGEEIKSTSPCSGGCISDAFSLRTKSDKIYFAKCGNGHTEMFQREEEGLKELAKAQAVRVPKVLHAESEFILMELIISGPPGDNTQKDFGRALAKLHKFQNTKFGLKHQNYIGSTPQINNPSDNWIDFFWQHRLLYQLKLAEKNKLGGVELSKSFLLLEKSLAKILGPSPEPPSLIHGDLWSGNFLVDEWGNTCLIDPAVYYGNREVEFGMITLFGGFNQAFHLGYQEVYPLVEGWQYRNKIYQLYHLMNHLNLFGKSYLGQVREVLNFYS